MKIDLFAQDTISFCIAVWILLFLCHCGFVAPLFVFLSCFFERQTFSKCPFYCICMFSLLLGTPLKGDLCHNIHNVLILSCSLIVPRAYYSLPTGHEQLQLVYKLLPLSLLCVALLQWSGHTIPWLRISVLTI